MNHYEILGVRASASKSEIRRAYLKLARRYHPDFHQSEAVAPETAIAEKIRHVNAAWEILGDEQRRREYDQLLLSHRGRSVPADSGSQYRATRNGAPSVSRIKRPSTEFTPIDDGDDLSGVFRYQPDEVNPATVPSRWLLAAPAVFFAFGISLLVVSIPIGIRALTAFGLISLFASGLLFIGVPVIAMFKSRNEELRSYRRR